MSVSPNDAASTRPPTVADATPQAETDVAHTGDAANLDATSSSRFGGLAVSTSALRSYTLLFALLAVWLFFQWATADANNPYGTFLTARNFSNLMRQTSVTGTLAVGMLMLIVAGQIDLSVGSVVGFAGGAAAIAQASGYGFPVVLAVAIAVGLAIGLLQGSLVAYANIPAFIVTLGGLLAWRGAIKGVSQGSTIPITDAQFRAVGQDYLAPQAGYALLVLALAAIIYTTLRQARSSAKYDSTAANPLALIAGAIVPLVFVAGFIFHLNSYAGIPIPVLIFIVVALVGAFVTQNTTFGRYLYAIGGNPDAARLSGISLRAHTLAVFCIIGALAGVASIIYTARVGAASPDAGTLLELDAIAACVIGGASLMGGRGTILGACLGALFMASLDNGMSLLSVKDFYQDIVTGVILVVAVGLDMLGRKRG